MNFSCDCHDFERIGPTHRRLFLVYRFLETIATRRDEVRLDELVPTGVSAVYADLARLGHVTRARVTQIMNLLGLAPDIQESILCWPAVTNGKDPISERGIRDVVGELDWKKQRLLYDSLLRSM